MNRFPAMFMTVAALVLGACGDGAASTDRRVACDPRTERALRAWGDAGFSGSVAVMTRGTVDCAVAYGWADRARRRPNTPGTVFSIGSITKAFTAAAVLDLVDAGRLSLTDTAGEHLPGLRGAIAGATIEQLLLHASGLKGSHGSDHEPLSRDEAIAAINGLDQEFEPGERSLYSNAGYTLLALIVEQGAGTGYREYLASHLLPLPGGGRAGGFWDGEPAAPGPRAIGDLEGRPSEQLGGFSGPFWAVEGNGGLAMTMEQLAAWTDGLLTGEIAPPVGRQIADGPRIDLGRGRAEVPGWVAFDRAVLGRPFLASAGGGGDVGHNAVSVWIPGGERAIAIASNTPGISAEELLRAIGPALAAGDPVPRPDVGRRTVRPAALAALAGRYRLAGGGSFVVRAGKARLTVAARGRDAVAALMPPHGGLTARDVAAHEVSVRAILAGDGADGRKERAALKAAIGPIEAVRLAGTVVEHGELRTYVVVSSADASMRLWYAATSAGAIAAADADVAAPSLALVASGPHRFRPYAPAGDGPDVRVAFRDGRMRVAGAGGTVHTRVRD